MGICLKQYRRSCDGGARGQRRGRSDAPGHNLVFTYRARYFWASTSVRMAKGVKAIAMLTPPQ